MPDSPTILLAGGGTGGHLYPGISVAEALRKVMPDCKPVFLCTQREIDRVILEPTGFEFIPQPIVPPVKSVGGLLKFWKSWRETKDLVKAVIRERKPAAALGLGGYAAGVAIKRAAEKKTPTAILNPDVIPGKANQYLMRYAEAVCCQFEETAEHVSPAHRGRLKTTGCPIRADIRALPTREAAAARLGLNPSFRTLLVTGASLGAQTVNEAVIEMLKGMTLQGWQVLHLSGREHADAVRAGYRGLETVHARVIDFTPAMADVWAVSDLAIARAGASSCAELTACGVPSILMPYPYHKDLHQRANAKVLADAGAAILLDDEKDAVKNAAKLRPAIEPLISDSGKRHAMGTAARSLGKPDAAEQVAAIITQMITSGR
ncbi:MAG: UDP-N-acetylglucosamine--N-acetylmuramyl-(pentapeptide) pyrophosphoryl-undecaprenol N-acetylglucosamine transferase [Tepidisphaeraceae bacterium]